MTSHAQTLEPNTSALLSFLDASPTPYHCVESARKHCLNAGYVEIAEGEPWTLEYIARKAFCIRDGAFIAFDGTGISGPDELSNSGFTIIGAHTDSPNLRLKPNACHQKLGYSQLEIEIYGGALNNSWLDRDLKICGRLILRSGESLLVDSLSPVARISQLAIHLDRDVNEKGLILDKHTHLAPIVALDASGDFYEWVCQSAGVALSEVMAFDLMLADTQGAAVVGREGEFITSARLDNQFSCLAALSALTKATTGGSLPIVALFDHEEVGSLSTTGAAGSFLPQVMGRINAAVGLGRDQEARAALHSLLISADMAHALHPNYPERSQSHDAPIPNAGPVLKLNANQRYATSAKSVALFNAAASRATVATQTFTSRNNIGCGSTIGPSLSAQLGIETIDLGAAMLSMHSAREMCGSRDLAAMVSLLTQLLGR